MKNKIKSYTFWIGLSGAVVILVQSHAYVKLWKHHGATAQALHFDKVVKARKETFLTLCGDTSSSEFFFPKILETLENAPKVYEHTYRFYDAVDWLRTSGNLIE